jgi:hypothetical protein
MVSTMHELLRGLLGLFVDDGVLALGVLAVVGVTALLIKALGVAPLVAGACLPLGMVLVLAAGAARAAARKPQRAGPRGAAAR